MRARIMPSFIAVLTDLTVHFAAYEGLGGGQRNLEWATQILGAEGPSATKVTSPDPVR